MNYSSLSRQAVKSFCRFNKVITRQLRTTKHENSLYFQDSWSNASRWGQASSILGLLASGEIASTRLTDNRWRFHQRRYSKIAKYCKDKPRGVCKFSRF